MTIKKVICLNVKITHIDNSTSVRRTHLENYPSEDEILSLCERMLNGYEKEISSKYAFLEETYSFED